MAMLNDFVAGVAPPESQDPEALWFVFSNYRLLVRFSGGAAAIPITSELGTLGVEISRRLYLGRYRDRACFAAAGTLPRGDSPEGSFQELRSLYGRLKEPFYELALLGEHLVEWDKAYQFCSTCGGRLKSRADMRAKECDACGRMEFPRISPAIIVLVERGDTMLLARSPRFVEPFYSVLAGFVEPGESLEEAVQREVLEETGIRVKNVAYFGSQPWPFPDSLMVGFTAEYESGEIKVDGEEIVEAGWYKADNLPRIPGKLSIARKLIDWFVDKQPHGSMDRVTEKCNA
ncbi:MAG: NAD(+) diphosphatase [Acidobacteriota bacterium]|nr:NAD(+) diphosphatase [Acidobacteriota bacterium]